MADYTALQAIASSTEAQLVSVQTQKATLVTQLQTLLAAGSKDISSISSSGGEGSESYTAQTLTEKIEQLARVEQILTDTLREQKALAAESGPGIVLSPCRVRPW